MCRKIIVMFVKGSTSCEGRSKGCNEHGHLFGYLNPGSFSSVVMDFRQTINKTAADSVWARQIGPFKTLSAKPLRVPTLVLSIAQAKCSKIGWQTLLAICETILPNAIYNLASLAKPCSYKRNATPASARSFTTSRRPLFM